MSERNADHSPADIRDLLVRTSRTFALAIPLLPEPTQTRVCLSYLLFRVVDTLEDAASWSRADRIAALDEFAELVREPDRERLRAAGTGWIERGVSSHPGYVALLAALPDVFAEVGRLDGAAQRIAFSHVRRTAIGMRAFLEGSNERGQVRLQTLEDLRRYCYVVAGIVGELLTELFVHDVPRLAPVKPVLVEHQAAFGEALQLVNILKDEHDDDGAGRAYLPAGVARQEVIDLARQDLVRAGKYTEALRRGGAPAGLIAFTAFPAALAEATLALVERNGPGSKVSRALVGELLARFQGGPAADQSASAHSGK